MADTTALKNRIRAAIKANDNQEITGPVLQQTLLDIVDELDLNPELQNEAEARQNGDNTLQQNITAEKNRAEGAESTLQQNIIAEKNRAEVVETQLSNLITGIKNNIDNGYVYAGIATPSTIPVTTGRVFYLALIAGTYTNFGDITITRGINILKYNGSIWLLDTFTGIDDEPTAGSYNLVNSDGVFNFQRSTGSNIGDFGIADEEGNVIVNFRKGHIKTKNFDSEEITDVNSSVGDFGIADEEGNVIVNFRKGHIKTKNFDSEYLLAKNINKIVFIGDSITEAPQYRNDKLRYTDLVSKYYSALEVNLGLSGSSIISSPHNPQMFIDRVTQSHLNSADIVVIFGGTNDFVYAVDVIGDIYSEQEIPSEYWNNVYMGIKERVPTSSNVNFAGAYNDLIAKIREYNSLASIILITPMHRPYYTNTFLSGLYLPSAQAQNKANEYLQDYVDAIRKIGEFYSFPVVDLWSDSNLNSCFSDINNKYFMDEEHPNQAGHEIIAKILINKINELI